MAGPPQAGLATAAQPLCQSSSAAPAPQLRHHELALIVAHRRCREAHLLWCVRHTGRKAGEVLLVWRGLRLHSRHVRAQIIIARHLVVASQALLLQHAGQRGLIVLAVLLRLHHQLVLGQQLHALRIWKPL